MIGLIFSSIVSGLIVARTGRYKWLLVGAITLIGVATLFMTQLNATTPVPVVWLWMFLAGLGVGPTFSVFTIVVQNAVPFSVLGVATSNLTFLRQIGGTVALSFVGTIFATSVQEDLPKPFMEPLGNPALLGCQCLVQRLRITPQICTKFLDAMPFRGLPGHSKVLHC